MEPCLWEREKKTKKNEEEQQKKHMVLGRLAMLAKPLRHIASSRSRIVLDPSFHFVINIGR